MKNGLKLFCLISIVLAFTKLGIAQNILPAPDMANVKYGTHERNVFDIWFAKTTQPSPLVIYIHGGGFRNGDKKSIKAKTLSELLDAGISVAAIHYRFIQHAPLPAAHEDSRLALQFLRHKAVEWNIDKTRIGAFGGSAGAQICMWLAFTDDMANANAIDVIEKESTRLTCVATSGGQTTMNFNLWMKWIPGYDKPHVDVLSNSNYTSMDEYNKEAKKISALSLISKDDPPIFMSYGMKLDAAIPKDPKKAQGWKVHHVIFGVKLKEKMDNLDVEAHLKYPGTKNDFESNVEFFKSKLIE